MRDRFTVIDLTHFLEPSIPTWNGSCGFHAEIKMDYDQGVRVMQYKMHAGVSTHMDAPNHFIPNGDDIADIPLDQLIVPAYVIDVSAKRSPDLMITPEDIGEIEKGALVIGYTGWNAYWNEPDKYRNNMRFPGFSAEAADFLLERDVVGIGIDTLSPDGSNMEFPVHHKILGAGKYIIENLTNLDKMPREGAYVIALPPKVVEGTEAAIRAIGLIQQEK